MKSRLILLAIAFAVLAIVGIAVDDARSLTPQSSAGVATTITAQQTPAQDVPVIVSAAANTPASAQTILDFTPHRTIRPAPGISAQTEKSHIEKHYDVTTPQSIPLLI